MMNYRWKTAAITALMLCSLPAVPTGAQVAGDLYRIHDGISKTHMEYHQVSIPAGKEVVLGDLKGPGKVTYWYITDSSGGKFYPGLVLKVFWDGESDPSINVPLSDFFGAMGGHTIDYQSVPMQINHMCYMCYLPMPFSERAHFVLANDGNKDYSQSMAYGIDYEDGRQYAQEKSRLHCAWRRSNPTKDGMHTILEVRGRGHYVGNFLQVYTKWQGWWGEGDTIFHLDGKTMTHTPGTEDEYGACWGFDHTYSYSYSGYLQNDKGNNRMYRWYLANPVRFQESLKVEIQNQRYEKGQIPSRDDYTSIAWWYQEDPHQPIALKRFSERIASSEAAEYKK
jgi:hypothetical protein